MADSFGIYIHVPYCLQRCTYCDFATYVRDQIMPPSDYFALLSQEIQTRSQYVKSVTGSSVQTVYFGGGTPSLVPAEHLVGALAQLQESGFVFDPDCEITLEINPATVDPLKMDLYQRAGFNRFSVGAQTFNDTLLKSVHREHNADQTRQTLRLLQKRGVNYSFDLLFALPGQTLDILNSDLDEVVAFLPAHVSPYCLTVPEGHVLAAHRPLEDIQIQMFDVLHKRLSEAGYERYEISNYARQGLQSRHNNLYWRDASYWGLGLSAHSYLASQSLRFWNPNSIGAYETQIKGNFTEPLQMPAAQFEKLRKHQALTDFCHTALRLKRGLWRSELFSKFGASALDQVSLILANLIQDGLVGQTPEGWTLTDQGVLLSNQVFGALTFLEGEIINF